MSKIPTYAPGDEIVHDDQPYICMGVMRCLKPAAFAVWESHCAECGAPFQTITPANAAKPFAPARRCPAHAKPGVRVRRKPPGKPPGANVIRLKPREDEQ